MQTKLRTTLFSLPLLALAALMLAGCQDSDASAEERSALLVSVEPVVAATGYTVQREFIGRVEATRQSAVGFELAGELRALSVDEGDQVSAGALLARLDTARLEARLAEARAAQTQALSARDFAARSFERSEEAAAFDGISDQELDLARDAANAASAGVAAADARVNSVEVDLAKSRLRAPYDAVVIARLLDEGNIVSPGQPVFRLQERAAPEVRIGVAAELATSLAAGDAEELLINGRVQPATVRAVLPVQDPATRTVDVILTLADVNAALPGDLARLEVDQTVDEGGFWVPTAALAEGSRGLWTAYIVKPLEDGKLPATGANHFVEPRPVEVLYKEGTRVFVRGALAPGDRFVTGGLQRIVPYQEVRVADAVARAPVGSESS